VECARTRGQEGENKLWGRLGDVNDALKGLSRCPGHAMIDRKEEGLAMWGNIAYSTTPLQDQTGSATRQRTRTDYSSG